MTGSLSCGEDMLHFDRDVRQTGMFRQVRSVVIRGPGIARDQGNRKTVASRPDLPQVKINHGHAG